MKKLNRIKKYHEWFLMGIKSQLAYRAAIIDRILGFIVKFIVLYFFWKAVYTDNLTINNRTFQDIITYLSLSITISVLYISPAIYFISEEIKSGDIIYLLVKPIDYQFQFISKQFGIFLFMSILMSLIFVFFYSIVIGIPIPVNPFYFLISLLLSFFTMTSFNFLLGVFSFWTENSWGLSYVQFAIIELLSGILIPLDFFPEKIRDIIINYLPFKGIVYTPITIFQNPWTIHQFLTYLFTQVCWITLFIILGRVVFNKARKVVMINGG